MKKSNYISIIISLLTLSFVACDDNLNIEPEQNLSPEVATESPANVKKILNNIYGVARDNSSYGGGIALASELLGNSGGISWNGTFVQPAEYNEKALLTDNSFVRNIWLNAYDINNEANIVLSSLDVFTDSNEKNVTEGEAKFLRGLAYFDLARLFAKPYVPNSQNTQLAVPIVLDAVLDASIITYPSRNTLEEVYVQVIADLKDAYDLLPDSNDIYATKYSAGALLARVYLEMGDYDNARAAANDVINNSGLSLTATFDGAFNNGENSNEDLFAWQVTSQDASSNDFSTFWAGSAFGGRNGNPDVSITAQHFTIYNDPNDARALFFYVTSRGTATTKWQNQFGNIPFLRLAEMYLVRAESNFRKGTAIGDTPLNDINALRARANASLYTSVNLATILMERKRELAFEGFALFDAKRLGENVGSIPFNANQLVLPIPLREMDVNPNLTQNDGY
ncbi:MAG: RagB/SusD family nutrient uptake outer membrane protein [Lutibacter sp.]